MTLTEELCSLRENNLPPGTILLCLAVSSRVVMTVDNRSFSLCDLVDDPSRLESIFQVLAAH